MRDLYHLLVDATDQLDQLGREAVERARAVTTGRDPAGHVTATLTGDQLTALQLDEGWSARAGGDEIGVAVTAAIAEAYAAVDEPAGRPLTGRWPFPELDRFTAGPAALLAALGLPDPAEVRHAAAAE